jgi:hypothetical protein
MRTCPLGKVVWKPSKLAAHSGRRLARGGSGRQHKNNDILQKMELGVLACNAD